MTVKKIGEINGRWALLFKGALVLVPLSIPLLVWLVSSAWASNDHIGHADQLTAQIEKILEIHARDMELLRVELKEIDRRLDDMPPSVWRDKITSLEAEMRLNAEDHTQIKVSLSRIEAFLGTKQGE